MRAHIYQILFSFILVITLFGCVKTPDLGVSLKLAHERKEQVSNIEYTLEFIIPKNKADRIIGSINIRFSLLNSQDVVIDFREDQANIKMVSIDKKPIDYRFENGHIIIPKKQIKQGNNSVSIEFLAGESSLNRKDDFLYTLFVPDRASTSFPCFDQPDLKAVYNLNLVIPKEWTAVTNGPLIKSTEKDSVKYLSFGATQPISTYLFAFVTGKFETISRTEAGRSITMYHRENDTLKVKRNLDAIFTSHFHSLQWLKEYTGIDYPFGKLDIILIPDFQYSGMEHPGAIYYRDSQLFLDENPSVNQKLRGANLVAHEVSHQWFGDLVTMRWFNDVWLKEVFAGFMADKIVNPQYPEVNHELNFLLSHYPRAYSVDRTDGANPIRQNLENLLFAGTLYGDIIYHKAPVMMMQLELLMGQESFQKGLREYLIKYSMGNADWEELVSILDPLTPHDLSSWSKAWVNHPGMPKIVASINCNDDGTIKSYSLKQSKSNQASSGMGMKFTLSQSNLEKSNTFNVEMTSDTVSVSTMNIPLKNGWILPNADGKGYGAFNPDSTSLKILLDSSLLINDNIARASWFVMLNELFLNGKVDAEKYYSYLISKLTIEVEPQTRLYLLNSLELVWWKFLSFDQQKAISSNSENSIFKLIFSKSIKDEERKPIFWTYARMAASYDAKNWLFKVWNGAIKIKEFKLDESDFIALACELAVRNFGNTDSIIAIQESRIKNSDRLAKFRFMKRAISPDKTVRDSFFTSLKESANRRPEPWVTESLQYFHHPLRADSSIDYLKSALDLLPEIQRTGDIFFPKSWLEATLWGYSSIEAFKIVQNWLNENPELPKAIRDKVLQSSDYLRRAAENKK